MNYVSFPGLGIEPFGISRVAFSVFGIDIMWYGVLITLGMVLAYLYGLSRAKLEKVKSDDITDFTLFIIIFGVIGARLYYVLCSLDSYIITDRGSLWNNILASAKEIVSIRNGGLAIPGGIIAGFLTALTVARVKKIRFPVILDIVAPCVLIGQIVGRWGNFINVEAYGSVTDLPWRMGVGFAGGAPFVHPTFLYESLWNLVAFAFIALFLYKRKRFHGQIFYFYLIWYGAGRAVIEGLRSDSLMVGDVRITQIVSILAAVLGIVLTAVGFARKPKLVHKATETGVENTEEALEETQIAENADSAEDTENTAENTEAEATSEKSSEETENGENN